MRSRVHIKSHPLHPILVPFPIAFLSGSFLFDLAGWITENENFHLTSYYIQAAGILFAILAAVPGLIDLLKTVPPNSSAKKRGVKHGLLNSTMLVLFIIAWFYRRGEDPELLILLLIELVATILMSIAGWMGGTLVYRNQIGVDPRYAHATKWREIYIKDKNERQELVRTEELKVNQMILVHKGDKRIVLARTENDFVAFDDRCPHKGASLAGGAIMCGKVQCPWHGSQFDVHNGHVTAGPSESGIPVYQLQIEEGMIYLLP